MQWRELNVITSNEAIEAVNNILVTYGAEGVQIKDETADVEILTYFPAETELAALIPEIKQAIVNLQEFGLNPGKAEVLLKDPENDSWVDVWEQYYHPVRVSRYLTIVPKWEEYTPQMPDEKLIILNPGRSFGTGEHPTTILSLHALENTIRGGETMIDVGTGSGVLSIAAKQLGVNEVFAYDIDDVAVAAALENICLNPGAKDIHVSANNLLENITQPADLIIANMLPEVLVPLLPQTLNCLQPHGHLILSGIIHEQFEKMKQLVEATGYEIKHVACQGDWYGITAQLKSEG